jgi:HlyD family secretion protein
MGGGGQSRQGGGAPAESMNKGTVYVLREGKPVAVSVNLGITDNRNTEITGSELKAGDKIIVGIAEAGASAPSGGSLQMRAF